MIRAGNEDSFFADCLPTHGIFIVADGMGGHAAGEVASAMAVQIVTRELAGLADAGERGGGDVRAVVRQALRTANRAIYDRTIAESDKQGMGTTVSALILSG